MRAMRSSGIGVFVCAAAFLLVAAPLPPESAAGYDPRASGRVRLQFGIEWRLMRAGTAMLDWAPGNPGYQADLHLESAGLVSKLYRVKDDYRANMTEELCATTVSIEAEEGKRRRATRITFDRQAKKATYLERDMVKNAVVLQKETQIPPCVHDYIGGLNKLRMLRLEPGQSAQVPLSDGKKSANVRVEAQEREEVKTPLGAFKAVRYEVHMFNDALIDKKARLFLWLTDDARKLPVQIRVRMQFLIGTITLQLEKEDRV